VQGRISGCEEKTFGSLTEECDVVHVPDEGASSVVIASHQERKHLIRLLDGHGVRGCGACKRRVAAVLREQVPASIDSARGVGQDASIRRLVVDWRLGLDAHTRVQRASSLTGWPDTGRALSHTHVDGLLRVVLALDEDISSLAYAHLHEIGLVRLDGHEIVRDDGHGVAVDGEEEQGLGGVVDESETVRLACLELERCQARVGRAGEGGVLARVVVLPVDQHVVGLGWEVRNA